MQVPSEAKSVKCPGTGVPGSYELSNVGAGNGALVLSKYSSALMTFLPPALAFVKCSTTLQSLPLNSLPNKACAHPEDCVSLELITLSIC